jgi:transcriptional regulator with XRE-family HTH domain
MVGARVKDARKRRGLTQRELARLSRVSVSLVRKLEQGEYAGGLRLETLHRIAVALDVTTVALMSEPDAETDTATLAAWEPLRRALASDYDGEPDYEPTIGGVRDAFNDVVDAFNGDQYASLNRTLPVLLRDAEALASAASEGTARNRACQVRSQALAFASHMLCQVWQFDAATDAVKLAMDAPGDELTMLAAVDARCFVLLRQGLLADVSALAGRWAEVAEPTRISRATPDDLAAWGRLLMWASNSAVRDNRPDDARDTLRLARVAAQAVGRDFIPPAVPWEVFGPSTVAMVSAEHAVISGKPDVTLRVGRQVTGRGLPAVRHYHRHRLDVASAYAATRKLDEAVGVLTVIRSAAPAWLAQQRYARDILTSVITRKRRLSDETRGLADFMSLPA